MELTFSQATVKPLYNGDFELSLRVSRDQAVTVEEFTGKHKPGELWKADLKKSMPLRSMDANAYCWVLCGKLGKAMGLTKEEVYRRHIRDVGDYEPLPIANRAVERFCQKWSSKGIGWFVDIVDDAKFPGYKRVFAYYGSSTYDSKQMSTLIENLVQDCRAVEIETLPPEELERLLKEW